MMKRLLMILSLFGCVSQPDVVELSKSSQSTADPSYCPVGDPSCLTLAQQKALAAAQTDSQLSWDYPSAQRDSTTNCTGYLGYVGCNVRVRLDVSANATYECVWSLESACGSDGECVNWVDFRCDVGPDLTTDPVVSREATGPTDFCTIEDQQAGLCGGPIAVSPWDVPETSGPLTGMGEDPNVAACLNGGSQVVCCSKHNQNGTSGACCRNNYTQLTCFQTNNVYLYLYLPF